MLKNDGILIVAWAGTNHLLGLKEAIYDTAHINGERADMPKSMNKIDESRVSYVINLDSGEKIKNLFAMTPYSYRTSEKDYQKLLSLDRLETEVDVEISVYRKGTE